MSNLLRPLTSTATRASKHLTAAAPTRAFHSPFAVLGQSPLTTPQASSNANAYAAHYEKQHDFTHEPYMSSSGQRTYVVSEPDASFRHYAVPAGAYPTSSPYIQFAAAEAPAYKAEDVSSTAADLLAHPFTTRAAADEAAEASKVPGAMGKRGGSYGRLAERNPQPDGPAAEKFSKGGVQNAWKMRI